MNTPTCILCGSVKNGRIAEENGFPVYRCLDCGLVYVYPLPSAGDLSHFYRRGGARDEVIWKKFSTKVFQKAARRISGFGANGKLLDVGCGYGFFMDLMREKGWEVRGLEMDEKAAKYAMETLGLDVRKGDLRSYRSTGEEFDLVSLWWVLEHLPDPVNALGKCIDSLKSGGMLILRVPNISFIRFIYCFRFIEAAFVKCGLSLSALVNPVSRKTQFFEILGAPYHLFGYSRRTIAALLKRIGIVDFDIVLEGKLRTSRPFRDVLETMLFAIAKFIYWLSFGRIIFYHDLTVYAKKK